MFSISIIFYLLMNLMIPMGVIFAEEDPMPESFGADFRPGSETMVQLVSEMIEINVLEEEERRSDFSFYRPVADVDATYLMVNQGNEDEILEVQFPLHMNFYYFEGSYYLELNDLKIFVNGEEKGWARIDLPNPINENSSSITWAVFDVLFPKGEDVEIVIQYQMPSLAYGQRTTFNYIFQTHGKWFDVIEQADVIVNLPYEA